MTGTPARDALADQMTTDHPVPCWPHEAIETMIATPALVLAALVESGWRPTPDDLRAMGGRPGRRVVAVGTLGTFWQFEGVDGD